MSASDTFYRRYMDDWVWVFPKKQTLRTTMKKQYGILHALRVAMHPDKTFIGKVKKGFDFLGFHLTPTGVTVSDGALSRHEDKVARLYEQNAGKKRIRAYRLRWLVWAVIAGAATHALATPAGQNNPPYDASQCFGASGDDLLRAMDSDGSGFYDILSYPSRDNTCTGTPTVLVHESTFCTTQATISFISDCRDGSTVVTSCAAILAGLYPGPNCPELLPTISIAAAPNTLGVGGTATVTFTLSVASTDFVAADVSVTGGAITGFSGSGTSYTATFTPTANSTADGVIKVASGAFTGSTSTKQNADGAEANNTVTLTVDTTPDADSATVTNDNGTIPNGDTTVGTSATAFCGTTEANAGSLDCTGKVSTTGKTLIVKNAYFKAGPSGANNTIFERIRQFSWWNLIGVSNALAVGFGDFSVDLTAPPYTITSSTPLNFVITFAPTAAGLRDGILVIEFDDDSTFEFAVSGMGTVATLTNSSSPQNIPIFGPFGLLAMLLGLLWFGNRRRKG